MWHLFQDFSMQNFIEQSLSVENDCTVSPENVQKQKIRIDFIDSNSVNDAQSL